MCRTKHLFCTNISKQTLDDLPSAYGGINWPGGKVLSARHEKEMLEVRLKQNFNCNFLFKES